MTDAPAPPADARPLKEDDPLAPRATALVSFLQQRLGGSGGALDGSGALRVERFGGGYSNLTYLVSDGASGAQVVVRTPPPGAAHIQSGHDMAREGRFLEKLHPVFPLAPRPLLIVDDADAGPLGVPFFVMEKKQGRVLRPPRPGKDAPLDVETMARVSVRFVDALAELHAVDVHATGLVALGKPDGFVRRQVEGWTRRDEKSRVDEVGDMARLARWLAEQLPRVEAAGPSRACVVHNDFKYDNVVVASDDPSRIVGVLDWELAAIGDARADLGTVLAYWVQADDDEALRMMPLGPTTLPGNLTRREIVARYEERTGRAVDELLFFVALGLYRVAVIAQQIYFRYAKGFTQDPRFASLGLAVAILSSHACRMIDDGSVP